MPQNKPIGAQVAAVQSEADHLLVIAPPGCGKTEVLAMRADRLIRGNIVRPGRRLLAITFTNRARDNLRIRLTQQLGAARLRSSVSVMNFHELSARLVEAHHRVLGIEPGFAFPRPAWQRRTLAAITRDKTQARLASERLAALNRQAITDEQLMERLESSGDRVAIALEKRRRADHVIDYGDLQRYAQLLLRNDRVAPLFQAYYDAVIVDEFQDLSMQQYDLSRRICIRNSTYVGDPFQGIFGWAGAQPVEVHADLLKRTEEAIQLDVSFRSSPAVLNVVNSISVSLGSPALHAANPQDWGTGQGHAYAASYDTDTAEADGIVALTDYLASQYPNDTIGVICRASYRRGAVERAYQHANQQPQFWDIALDSPRVARLLKLHSRVVDATASFADQVVELRQRATGSVSPTEIEAIGEISEACDQLLEYADEGVTVRQLMDRVRDNQTVAAIGPGVHVLNAHTGKGQQFDWVIVMGLEEGHVPSNYSDTAEKLLEDQRVLLVMLSRARKGLFLTHAAKNSNQWGRVFTNQRTRWWEALAGACKPLTPELSRLLKAA